MGVGIVEAGGEAGRVGVVELHQAVGVGQDGAEVQPVEEINAGFDVEALARGTLGFQQDCAVCPALQDNGGVLDQDHFRTACGRCVVAGDIDVAVIIHSDGIASSVTVARTGISVQPDLIAVGRIFDRDDVI